MTSAAAALQSAPPRLDQFRRVVIKVGSSLLVDRARGRVKREWLTALAEDIAALHKAGADVLVVSSGSIALGRTVLGLPDGALKLDDSQAAAAVGQIALARIWAETLGHLFLTAGQILVTLATPNSASAISTRAPPSRACLICAPSPSSTRMIRWRPRKSAMAIMTASLPASPPWPAPTCSFFSPTSPASPPPRPAGPGRWRSEEVLGAIETA